MTSSMKTLCLVLATLCFALPSSETRRLLLGDDGFARVDGTSSTVPASGITVSSWVNITEFPGGVAPIVTLISEDASYQIAFFVRHDGAGVLWGGPAERQLPPPQDDYVDRHPRSRFGSGRKRRNAVDYSMGLGNVMNIMSPRKERSNTWTPMNFVDVSEMGVADLETSGSNTNNHYENWYDVGYELQMQESADPEPRIITQPSGENDFVVINWDRQNTPPLSSNQWDPVNEDLHTPEIARPQLPTNVKAPDNERFVWSQEENDKEGGWSSQVIPIDSEVKVPSNTRNFIPTTPRETTTTTTVKPASDKSRPRKRPTRPFVPDLRRPSGSENVNSYRSPPDSFRYNTRRRQSTTTTTTSTTSTTTKRPLLVSHEVVRNSQESRVPLWARLKKTASEEELISSETETTTETATTTTRAPERTASPITRIQVPTAQRQPIVRSTTTPEPEIQTIRPPVTSTRAPQPVILRKTVAPTTTSKPTETTTAKTKPPRRFRASNEVKDRKTYSNLNTKTAETTRKPYTQTRNNRPLTSHTLDEFKRVLEGKPAVEDNGNKVVVYSMPITDVDAFNRMYEQYQETEAKQNPRVNLQVVYEQAMEGEDIPVINEDESNSNRIEQVPEPMPILTYKEEPLHFAEEDPEPILVVEEGEAPQEQLTKEIVVVEEPHPVHEGSLPAYDDSSFRPLAVDNPYSTLEKDYSSYYPYVQKAEPVMVSTLNDQVPEGAINQYRVVEVPHPAASDILEQHRPILYDSAVPAEQDIGGHRAGFYQEPSRISHEQLPPEYTQKLQTENKRVFDENKKTASNKNANIRPTVSSQTLRLSRPFEAEEPQGVAYSSPEVVGQNIPLQNFIPRPIQSAERVRLSEEMIKKIQLQNIRPIAVDDRSDVGVEEDTTQEVTIQGNADVPTVATNTPEIQQEVPLNVNFRKMPYNFDLNTWYHVTFSWSSYDHVLRIYINGQLAGILEETIPDLKVLPTQGMVLLGKTLLPSLTGFDPTSHLTGEMSNFVVWGEALSPSEVNDVFTCGASPTHPVLLAWNKTPLRVYNDAVVQQAPPICGISS